MTSTHISHQKLYYQKTNTRNEKLEQRRIGGRGQVVIQSISYDFIPERSERTKRPTKHVVNRRVTETHLSFMQHIQSFMFPFLPINSSLQMDTHEGNVLIEDGKKKSSDINITDEICKTSNWKCINSHNNTHSPEKSSGVKHRFVPADSLDRDN